VYVADATGAPMGGAAAQRRVLAFLSALAVAGDGGLSRDRIAALLWPDADTDRARHSVTQALYAARRALRADDLFEAGSDIRLNRKVVTSDVLEFQAALESGEHERAVALYQGSFLEGFFLSGSPEFEQWSSAQRARLEDGVVVALAALATRSEDVKDFRGAVEWRKRLAALRPLDSAVAADLMRVLAAAGDRAGAIRHAEVHAILLREELGIEPDAGVIALAARLREPAPVQELGVDAPSPAPETIGASASEMVRTAPGQPAPGVVDPAPSEPAPAATLKIDALPSRRTGHRLGRLLATPRFRWMAAGTVGFLAVVAAALVWSGQSASPASRRPATEVRLRQTVVVAPFRVAGASDELSYLSDGLVELLSVRLSDDSAARSVDAGAVLSTWRTARIGGDVDMSRETAVRLAASLGAERVVIGSVVGTPRRAILSASVVTVATGAVVGAASVEGPTDSLTTLVDRLAARLLVQAAGEDGTLTDHTTESLSALRAFLAGQAAFRRNDYDEAMGAYERALRRDTSFALAALQLVRSADRLRSVEDRDWALALAWQSRAALSGRDAALLVALAGPRYPAPSTTAELLAAWRRPVQLTPERADSWYELGARLFHDGAAIGLTDATTQAAAALRRALEIDSTHHPARELLAHLAVRTQEQVADVASAMQTLREAHDPFTPFLQWRIAAGRDDDATLRDVRDTMPRLGRANLRAIAQAAQFDVVSLADARRAVELLQSRARQLSDRLDAANAAYSLSLNEGRLRDAAKSSNDLADLQSGARATLRLRVLDALYADGHEDAASAAAQQLARRMPSDTTARPMGAEQAADACVLAQWRVARGDTAGVARLVAALRGAPVVTTVRVSVTPPALCADLVEAWMAVSLRRPDAPVLVARLDSLAFTAPSAGDAAAYAAVLLGRLHAELGDGRAALAAVRRRPYMVGWPRYLATALREEGRYAAGAGDAAGARSAYARYLVFRADADSSLAADVQRARLALDALRPGGPVSP
jgi:DNA-binding SARP family transcriptional activator/TolB-like protein